MVAVACSSPAAVVEEGFEVLVSLLVLFERRRVSFLSAVKGADVTPIGELVRARSASWFVCAAGARVARDVTSSKALS